MAAYAALLSLSQTTLLSGNQETHLFSTHAEEKIRSIHEYVDFMLSFLEDFPEKGKRWEEGRARDVAHEIEDIIMWHQSQSRFISTKPPLRYELDELTEEIGLIAGLMMEDRPDCLPTAVSSSSITPAATGNDAVVGLEEDVMAMKERLCGQSLNLQVVPIVGMAGIGKTTLARTLYDDPLILEHFEIRVWLTVSQDYSSRRILLDLLDSMKILERQRSRMNIDESEGEEEELCANSKVQLSREEIGETEMVTKVYQNLKWRRYLIVMDDVWSKEVWDDVMNICPDDNNGSRIILTTRLMDLAAYSNPDSHFHEMQFMDEYRSWDLLKKRIFRDGHCPSHLENIGKAIARSCAGLPLSIVLVAGVLSVMNSTKASWEEIAGTVNPAVESKLEEILSLSYTHLPHHLRPCFLLLGGFPEDENVHASKLTKLWVAEGFFKHEKGCCKSFEDKAEEYLEDLVKRNVVIVTSRKSDGKIKSCCLHDKVRDLCLRKAKEEKFLHVVDGNDIPQGMMNKRRISFNRFDFNGIWGPTIRTIFCFQLQSSTSWIACLQGSRLLKVLNAVSSNHKDFPLPSQVFQLYHLTYLALIGSFSIPSAISSLVNLQTLIIHPTTRQRTRNSREYESASHFSLPSEIWRMWKLRHLVLYDLYMLPDSLDGSDLSLENLQTLLHVENLVWSEKMVQMIPNMKKLGLVYTLNHKYHLRHLNNLLHLKKLQVTGYGQFSWRGHNPTFPRALNKLTLVGGRFPWKNMAIIGSLPNLQVLKLRDHACYGVRWETTDDEFPELKYLLIDDSVLEQWVTQGNPFPRLQHLVLRSCRRLGKIPEGIGEIPTLELIEVVGYCRSSLRESVDHIKKEQESFGNDALQICPSNDPSQIAESGKDDLAHTSVAQLCRQFSFKEIRSSTGDFSKTNLIGECIHGKVYKGLIDNGCVTVSIRRVSLLSRNKGEMGLAVEMETLTKVRHCNLICLIDYCIEKRDIILVYEYMSNGTLKDHLYLWSDNRSCRGNSSYLTWNQRLKICIGAAQGLDHLHSRYSIVHCHVNSANILLDENFTAKVSNCWFAKQLDVIPEKFGIDPNSMAHVTYDFGMILLEVLCGRRTEGGLHHDTCLSQCGYESVDEIVARHLKDGISEDSLKTFIDVAKRCLHYKAHKRPKMSQVVTHLELALEQQERKGTTQHKLQFRPFWNRVVSRIKKKVSK